MTETKTETPDALFSICARDDDAMKAAKQMFSAARGEEKNAARVRVLRLRFQALHAHSVMLSARLALAADELRETRAALKFYAPEVLREIDRKAFNNNVATSSYNEVFNTG